MKICPSCKTEYPGGEVFCPNDGARLTAASEVEAPPASADPLVGTVLNERYLIHRQIGEGGMGLVYEAEHIAIEKKVALKVLRDDFSGRTEVVERFKQEAKSASRIGNEHIVDISDFGVTPSGASYFVMELLEGEDLAEVLEREGTLPLQRAADIILQCCKALGAAHRKGIVHRDMKPENIFLTERDGRRDFVKIVDFGIAKMSDIETPGAPGRKLTKTGMIFGTPEYMSPEQAAGKKLDHRVDLYGMAVILFEMLSGRVPFVGDTFMGVLTQHMFEDPPDLHDVNPDVEVPEPIVAFLWKGLAKDPADRFQTAAEMAEALQEALGGQAVGPTTYQSYGETTPAAPRSATAARARVAPPPRSRVGLISLGGLLLAAAVGGGAFYLMGADASGERTSTDARMRPPERDAGLSIAEPPREEAEDAGAEAPPAVDAGPAMVTVSVNTTPSGARVYVEGRGEVCEASPCSFQTVAGEDLLVRARSGRSEGEARLAPTENTTIQLEMRRRRRGGGRRGGGSHGHGGGRHGGGGAGGGDLKIPDIFRNR